uniref:Uncharacterized protein n=1 Tax=Anopheles culicifacies TaxID=139723 RepID=A0A182MQH8_9DIPT
MGITECSLLMYTATQYDYSNVGRLDTSRTKSQISKVTAPGLSVGTPLLLKQIKGSQNKEFEERINDAIKRTTRKRKFAALSDNSSCLESDDSCDSSRLQAAWNGDNQDTQSNHSEGSESSGNNSTNSDAKSMVHLKHSSNPLKRYTALITLACAKVAGVSKSDNNLTNNDDQSISLLKNSTDPLKRYNALLELTDAKIPVVYNKRMVRKFPTKDRTPEEVEMRRRYTESNQIFRSRIKMAEHLMEKEANELSTANTAHKHMIASQLVYANELSKLLDMRPVDLK